MSDIAMTAKNTQDQSTIPELRSNVQRGSLITLKEPLNDTSNLAIVVSNDLQNNASDFLLVVPLQRRVSRLKAPFAVDLGRTEGMRDLHSARCDWITRIRHRDVDSIERAKFPDAILEKLELGLKVALGFHDTI